MEIVIVTKNGLGAKINIDRLLTLKQGDEIVGVVEARGDVVIETKSGDSIELPVENIVKLNPGSMGVTLVRNSEVVSIKRK